MSASALGARVARHTLWTMAGFAIPFALALVAIPVTAHALGPARFGLLGLAWAIVEYLGIFDFGLTRATIRFVADGLVRAPATVRQIVSVSLAMQVVAGLAGGAVLWLLAPFLSETVFSIPRRLVPEATAMFSAVAANVTIVIVSSGMRGVLEAAQRFDLAAAVKIPGVAAAVVIPAIGATAGASLPEIFLWVFAARVLLAATVIALIPFAIHGFRWERPRELHRLRSLFGYSGWVAVSGVAGPLLVSFDRFALGAIAGVAAVGFYAAPYEGAVRLLLVPVSVFAALFPVLTTTEALRNRDRTVRLIESSLRQLTAVLVPIVLTIVVFAPELLRVWLGTEFAAAAGPALRILAVGVLINAAAHVPSVYLYAVARPDLPAKLHVAELVLHLPLTYMLVRQLGVTGAALAWTLRVSLDAAGLALMTARLRGWMFDARARFLWTGVLAAAAALAATLLAARMLGARSAPAGIALVVTALGLFALAGWRWGLAPEEKTAWLRLLSSDQRDAPVTPRERAEAG